MTGNTIVNPYIELNSYFQGKLNLFFFKAKDVKLNLE